MIRLLVIEDNANIIIPGLRNLFRPERDSIKITCFAPDPDDALTKINSDDFDIILLDLWIPDFLPLENIKKLTAKFPGKPVIIYTQDDSPVWRRKMLVAGAKAFLSKSATRDDLKTAIIKVSKGEIWFSGAMAEDDQKKLGILLDGQANMLTPVQRRMVDMLTHGQNREEIASSLNLHPSAIDKTFSKLRQKFNCTTNYELIRILLDHGAL